MTTSGQSAENYSGPKEHLILEVTIDIMPSGYDAIVVGSGPNGLAAAITMQQGGLSVLLIEGRDTIGGGLRSSGLTLPVLSTIIVLQYIRSPSVPFL
jgi:ribulose 1,5-bisphosphate synthetase/thiazole synthase